MFTLVFYEHIKKWTDTDQINEISLETLVVLWHLVSVLAHDKGQLVAQGEQQGLDARGLGADANEPEEDKCFQSYPKIAT